MNNAIHPSHYGTTLDLFEQLELTWNTPQLIGAYKFNIIKYLTRHERKNGLEDIRKAQVYLDRLKGVAELRQINQSGFIVQAQEIIDRERAKYEVQI